MTIEVLKPGALSTFQDLGRFGHQHHGIPVSGVMDERSHRLACMLVGNAPSQATLEVTLIGPTLKFEVPAVIAVCGADLGAMVNGRALPLGAPVAVAAGDLLSFGKRTSGLRAYIAVAGGYALQQVMGSTSTYVRGGFGGAQGGPLQKGYRIALRDVPTGTSSPCASGFAFPEEVQRPPGAPLRIVPGREREAFAPQAHRAMTDQTFRVSPRSDRMGYRLECEPLRLLQPLELQSEAVSFGTIQVPPDGFPIVLLADRQTTGGYPRIANVATVDLPSLAQLMAGETVRFEWISLDEAQQLSVAQGEIFRAMEAGHGVH
jgi:antagonist of KipI